MRGPFKRRRAGTPWRAARRHGAPGFDPSQIEGIRFHTARDLTTVFQDTGQTTPAAEDGDEVGLWLSSSDSTPDPQQTVGSAKPPLRIDALGAGLHALEWVGSDNHFDWSIGTGIDTWTLFALMEMTSTTSHYFLDGNGSGFRLHYFTSGRIQFFDSTARQGPSYPTGEPFVVYWSKDGAALEQGILGGASTTHAISNRTLSESSVVLGGNRNSSGGNAWDGLLCDLGLIEGATIDDHRDDLIDFYDTLLGV